MSTAVATEPTGEPDPAPAERIPARRVGTSLSGRLAEVLSRYRTALAEADLSDNARRGYVSRGAGFLDWLATGTDIADDGDPLAQPPARDYAVRGYRSWLKTESGTKWGSYAASAPLPPPVCPALREQGRASRRGRRRCTG